MSLGYLKSACILPRELATKAAVEVWRRWVEAGEPNQLSAATVATATIRLLRDEEMRARMGQAGKEKL